MAGDATLTFGLGGDQRHSATSGELLAKAVLFAGVSFLALLALRSDLRDSIASLVGPSKVDARRFETRLSGGSPWAPFRTGRQNGSRYRAGIDAALESRATALRGGETPSIRHTEGVTELLADRPRAALSSLTLAAQQSNDPAVWSDLAAVLHEVSLRDGAPELLADALAACDRALSLQPQFPEARFNRAIVLEHLGLRDDAREAWDRYLIADSSSDWAVEARSHRDALAPEEEFLIRLDREYDRVGGDPAAALALARRDPFRARGMSVMEVLGRWGKAVQRHDERDAERHLRVARNLGTAAVAIQGDRMLERAVAAIDGAGESNRSLLASAHSDYRDGLKAKQENRPAAAEPLLRRAAEAFQIARSPMVLPARHFVANATFEQGHHAESERETETLLASASTEYPAYRALLARQLGTCHASRADWGGAITILAQAESQFDRLGEIENLSAVRRLLAFVYDRIGDPATAWKYRLASLRGAGVRSSVDLEKGVASIADAAILRHEWQTALSFLTLEIRIAHRLHDDFQLAATPLIRAAVYDRTGNAAAARADIADAKEAMQRTKDPAYLAYLRVASIRAAAMLSSTPPAEADSMLSEAIDYQTTQSDPLKLPGLFLERSRARRKIGNTEGAMSDIERGIAELEQHRRSLPQGEARWGAFHAAEELFDEGIDQAIAQGDVASAFRFAEQARARALLDSYGSSPVLDYRRLPAGTVVVEYAALPSRLVIFTASASGVRAALVERERARLIAESDAVRDAIRRPPPAGGSDLTAAVYRSLIDPVAVELMHASTVVFVPDAATSTVPFSALIDHQGHYLIEQHAIVVSPSAAAYAAAQQRRGGSRIRRTALVVSASDAETAGSALAYAATEARRVAQSYQTATRLSDDDAELDELVKHASEMDVIHFAGHAIGDDRGIEPASIIVRQHGHERRVGVAEIGKLHLRPHSVVVLAGCNTARGERRAAEGVISVAHGFLSAGAPSVIATLWQIDDRMSSTFFPRLHEKLAQGLSPSAALREAQLESIRRGDVPASLWAAVQDIGS